MRAGFGIEQHTRDKIPLFPLEEDDRSGPVGPEGRSIQHAYSNGLLLGERQLLHLHNDHYW
jgi:hypothetical protein